MAALRLCGLRVPWRLCGFAACAFHGGFAALRLARSMAALRLARSMAALRLCGFDALQGARVYPNPRAMLSCSFDSSHSFEIFSLSLDSCWLSFEVLLSFLSALFSFQASLSFKSYLVRSTPLIRLKSSLSLFRSSPVLFRSTPHIRLQPLSFVGLLLTFVRSNSFVSLCSFFV